MCSPQPPITNQKEYEGYRAAAQRLRQVILPHEQELWHAILQKPADQPLIDEFRGYLAHLYPLFQDIQDQISVHEAKQRGSP